MKRQLILGLLLVLLVLIAVGAYFLVDVYKTRKEQTEADEAAALQLGNFYSSDVTKMQLHTPDLDYTLETDDSGQWVVTSGEISINTSYISTLCTYGGSLTATEDLGTVDQDTLESYGLSDPVSITYYTADGETELRIGSQTPTKEYFYVMKGGSDHVYLVSADSAGYLNVTENQLRYRYVMNDMQSDICQVSLKKGDTVAYSLDNSSGEWVMTVPADMPIAVDNSQLNSLFVTILQLEADDFGDASTEFSAENGYTFQFSQDNGDVTTLIFEDYDTSTNTFVNCLREETGEILIFDSSYIKFLQSTAEDLLMDTLCQQNIEDVTEMTLQYEGSFNDKTISIDDTFVWDTEENTYRCNGKVLSDEAATQFQNFFAVATSLSYEELDMDSSFVPDEDEEPALTLTYTRKDDTKRTVTLYRKDDKTYWAMIDGQFSHAIIRQRALSGDDQLLETYTELMEIMESAAG